MFSEDILHLKSLRSALVDPWLVIFLIDSRFSELLCWCCCCCCCCCWPWRWRWRWRCCCCCCCSRCCSCCRCQLTCVATEEQKVVTWVPRHLTNLHWCTVDCVFFGLVGGGRASVKSNLNEIFNDVSCASYPNLRISPLLKHVLYFCFHIFQSERHPVNLPCTRLTATCIQTVRSLQEALALW